MVQIILLNTNSNARIIIFGLFFFNESRHLEVNSFSVETIIVRSMTKINKYISHVLSIIGSSLFFH